MARIRNLLFPIIDIFSSTGLIFSALFFGSKTSSVKKYSALMDIDNNVKQNSLLNTSYIHTDVIYDNCKKDENYLTELLQKQKLSYSFADRYFCGYVIASDENENVNSFTSDNFHSTKNGTVYKAFFNNEIITQQTFSDRDQLETMPLLLYKDFGINYNAINGANYGSYIPSSMADELLILTGCSNYDELLALNIVYNLNIYGKVKTYSINNIYINGDCSFVDSSRMKNYENKYLNYHKHFSTWTSMPIITADREPFKNSQCALKIDILRNYGNIRNTIEALYGSNYGDQGISLQFYLIDDNGVYCKSDGNNLDFLYSSENKSLEASGFFYLILVFLFFAILLVVSNLKKEKNRNFLCRLIYLVPFICVELIKYIIFWGYKRTYANLLFFNFLGSIIYSVLFMIIFAIVVRQTIREKLDLKYNEIKI